MDVIDIEVNFGGDYSFICWKGHTAAEVVDLKYPGCTLEILPGSSQQKSIRIDAVYCVCFAVKDRVGAVKAHLLVVP